MALLISIDQTKLVTEPKSHVVYLLRVECNNWQITLEKRYSEFLELHRVMKLLRRIICEELPRFPGKKAWRSFWGKITEEDLEDRRVGLETYTRNLAGTATAIGSPYFVDFFQMPAEVAEVWRASHRSN